ncbi:MAG: alpha-L-fucosidase [Capsulimonadaceae bacterium]|nr:alpha-L-fucosidase [Capsulimonadaceae bacterium]
MFDLQPMGAQRASDGVPVPSVEQLAFQDLELGLFIHYGMTTYTGESAPNGQEPVSTFAPENVDCDDWVTLAQEMGARFAVFTARHEEGFCLWPTSTTAYSIAHSAYRGGKADLVREFVDACRCKGITPCLYHPSYMDGHHLFAPEDDRRWHKAWFESTNLRLASNKRFEEFLEMQRMQIHELLTNYGPIAYLWLDHIGETQGILNPEQIDRFWAEIVAEARRCQPSCLLLKADIYLSRDRECGAGVHAGRAAGAVWHTCEREDTGEGQSDPLANPEHGTEYVAWESNTIFSGDWFWNGEFVKRLDTMIEHYYATVARGSTFLPNFAPNPAGRMPECAHRHAKLLGDWIAATFGSPLAMSNPHDDALELGAPAIVDHIEIAEDLSNGQRIMAYEVEGRWRGEWKPIVNGTSVGHKRILRIKPDWFSAVRIRVTRALGTPRIKRIAAYGGKWSGTE